MASNQESLNTLSEIRDLMERSSKFLSLSGLSGVFAGLFALIGAIAAYVRFKTDFFLQPSPSTGTYISYKNPELIHFLLIDGIIVLILSLGSGILFTVRKGKKRGLTLWNSSSKRLLLGMFIPLATGGIFCLALFQYGLIWLAFPVTLVFYGLALVTASRFTYPEVFYLGICEIVLGCIALFLTGYSLIFWAIGFGVLHIVYGATMYNKYDRKTSSGSGLKGGMTVMMFFLLASGSGNAQSVSDSTFSRAKNWYQKETIYLQGLNGYVKDNMLYKGQKALEKEFIISEGGMELFKKSKRTRNIALVFSLAGSVGSIISLINGKDNNFKTFYWVSLGTAVISTTLTLQANNLRDQAVWLRNRDAMFLIDANN